MMINTPNSDILGGSEVETEGQQSPIPPNHNNEEIIQDTRRTSFCCEIQIWGIVFAVFDTFIGSTMLLIYSTIIIGAFSEIRYEGKSFNEPRIGDTNKNDNQNIYKNIAGCYGGFLGFGFSCSLFMTIISIFALLGAVKKSRKTCSVCYLIGWIPWLIYGIFYGPFKILIFDESDEGFPLHVVYLIWASYFIIRIIESIIFYFMEKEFERLENMEDYDEDRSILGIRSSFSAQVHPTTNEIVSNSNAVNNV